MDGYFWVRTLLFLFILTGNPFYPFEGQCPFDWRFWHTALTTLCLCATFILTLFAPYATWSIAVYHHFPSDLLWTASGLSLAWIGLSFLTYFWCRGFLRIYRWSVAQREEEKKKREN